MPESVTEKRGGHDAILIAAERMFADYGLHGVSLRQISEAAGQKNTSAIQYHFGSRDKLVEAVFAMRMSIINPRRQAALDRVRAAGQTGNVRALVEVMVWPMAEELRPRGEGNHYVQFLSRASRERKLAIELAPSDLMSAWRATVDYLREAIRYLPEKIAEARVELASEQTISALAAYEAQDFGATGQLELVVETLIDMIAAGVTAPVSAQTLAAYS